jgi:hypothetical protein
MHVKTPAHEHGHEHSTAQHSTAQHSTAQHSTAQHSTAQHSTAQHSTAQHRQVTTNAHIPTAAMTMTAHACTHATQHGRHRTGRHDRRVKHVNHGVLQLQPQRRQSRLQTSEVTGVSVECGHTCLNGLPDMLPLRSSTAMNCVSVAANVGQLHSSVSSPTVRGAPAGDTTCTHDAVKRTTDRHVYSLVKQPGKMWSGTTRTTAPARVGTPTAEPLGQVTPRASPLRRAMLPAPQPQPPPPTPTLSER